ncbi:MAG TPA: hypothetical protein VNJ70_07675 [Thermoanaerobaculia bacterium]|nr:hypothetical protein [Thermoanaerobaculia bacterium]
MPKLEIELTDEQEERLRREAEGQGVPIDQATRALLRRGLGESKPNLDELWERALRLVGTMEDLEGATDLAQNHDRYLYGD